MPAEAWFSVSATPKGDIYVGGSDHRTNSALYRLSARREKLEYIGDAKSASEAAKNWLVGETAQKIHVRPLYFRCRLYFATADFTAEREGYLGHRGFHWYAYDLAQRRLLDLSASEPGGVGGAHASIIATAIDWEEGLIYALDTPRCLLFRYDIAKGRTENLGRSPFIPEGYFFPGRYIWIGRGGRVYFTASACSHVLYYDPQSGYGERKDWPIGDVGRSPKGFRTGTKSLDQQRVYTVDGAGRIYLYDSRDDRFQLLGQATSDRTEYQCKGFLKIRCFNVTPDEKEIYFINDDAERSAFWEWDVATSTTKKLCDLAALDGQIGEPAFNAHAGNDSWGGDGCIYFCSFGSDEEHPTPLVLSRVDPVKVKVQVGLLPEETDVDVTVLKSSGVELRRSGKTVQGLKVILKVQAGIDADAAASYPRFTIPSGSDRVAVDLNELSPQRIPSHVELVLTVVGDGDTYVAGINKRVTMTPGTGGQAGAD